MSRELKELCARHGVAQSVSRTCSCHDNAVFESFWATLKREFVDRFRFESRSEARRAITGWINHRDAARPHTTINNMSPIQWELQFSRRQIQAA